MPSLSTDLARASDPPTSREASGQIQMAVDSFLLSRIAMAGVTHFRTYRMSPSAVTIGRHQRWRRVVDEEACRKNGWDLVRRPTGGGALLHRNEVNYAVIAPRGLLAPHGAGEFRAVFDVIGHALSSALQDMGYNPELHIGNRSEHIPQHGLCGRSIAGNEIALGERKIIAAAQMITPSGILQHGTIYLRAPDVSDRFWPVTESARDADQFVQRWADLGDRCDARPWNHVAAEFERGFRRHFPAETTECVLTSDDWTHAGRIAERWIAADWHKCR